MLGYPVYPLAIRYLAAGLLANFICGVITDCTTAHYCGKMHLTLSGQPVLRGQSGPDRQQKSCSASTWHEICIRAGRSGCGGPLTVKPDAQRNKLIYVTGGGIRPDIVDRIEQLTGCTSVNGFSSTVPDEEVFLAVIDCGGPLRGGS